MARKLNRKEVEKARLLKEYASWVYCTQCNNTVAYLCYVTYDLFDFSFTCNCGSKGHVHLEFEPTQQKKKSNLELIEIKNRLCCPNDQSPLITIVEKNVTDYHYEIDCNTCGTIYSIKKKEKNI